MTATEKNTKNQHYVWRHYLAAWASSGTFCCYRQKDKKLFPTQPKSIANETYFYEIQKLSAGDRDFLDAIISKATDEDLRKLNREYVNMTQLTFDIREKLASKILTTEARAHLDGELRWLEKNAAERYHTTIENQCLDILDSLRNQNDVFYKDVKRCVDFLYFFSVQFFRTAKMKHAIESIPISFPDHDHRRTAAILNHIHATNMGHSLFRERTAYQIVFLRNDTPIPFIAGDQPIINMLDPKATDDVELYYPLTPKLAMLLTKDMKKIARREVIITSLEAELYNYSIYRMSEDQLYSNDAAYLGCLVKVEKNLLSP